MGLNHLETDSLYIANRICIEPNNIENNAEYPILLLMIKRIIKNIMKYMTENPLIIDVNTETPSEARKEKRQIIPITDIVLKDFLTIFSLM